MKKVMLGAIVVLFSVLAYSSSIHAIDVGTIERPPFAQQDSQGRWNGYSIEIVEEIARRSDLDITWKGHEAFADMLENTKSETVSFSAANISVTADREDSFDFSIPIFESGLQIFVPASVQSPSLISLLWSSGILQFIGLAFLILLIVAHLVWWFERDHKGQDYFRDEYVGGIWDAFWWAFIIVTIGGFENERPERPIGRIIAVFWILASIFFISTFTAKITTSLTVAQLQSDIQSVEDLRGKNIGAPKGTTISAFLDSEDIPYQEYEDFREVLRDVESENLDAGVGDAAVVQFYAANDGKSSIHLAGDVFANDFLAITFPEDSAYLETINKRLAELKEDGTLKVIHDTYFGQ